MSGDSRLKPRQSGAMPAHSSVVSPIPLPRKARSDVGSRFDDSHSAMALMFRYCAGESSMRNRTFLGLGLLACRKGRGSGVMLRGKPMRISKRSLVVISVSLLLFSTQSFAGKPQPDSITGYWKFTVNDSVRLYRPSPAGRPIMPDDKHVSKSIPVCFADNNTWYSPHSSTSGTWVKKGDRVMLRGNYIASGYQGGGNISADLELIHHRLMRGSWTTWSDNSTNRGVFGRAIGKKLGNNCDRDYLEDDLPPRAYGKGRR